jgi:hypothetical protein
MSDITMGSKWAGRGHEVTFKVIALRGDAAWVEFDDESLGTLTTAYILEEYREVVPPKPFFSMGCSYQYSYTPTKYSIVGVYEIEDDPIDDGLYARAIATDGRFRKYMTILDSTDFIEMEKI